ncbi:PIN domain-containing protein [Patescibacteria group bacterium]|nr:PIN domain-containing protein [Patescibacteria group bacterium]MBU1931659.1 PIN domain-containing protein [Patescibacteria group bacterium]
MKTKHFLIDTNFILRFLLDVPSQFKEAERVFKKIEDKTATGVVSVLVINELIWIFQYFYKKKRQDFIPQILKLLSLKNIKILEIKKAELINILKASLENNFDYTDLYLLFLSKKSGQSIQSFDKQLIRATKLNNIKILS